MVCNQAADLPSVNIRAETYGPGSRCIEQGRQWLLMTNGSNITSPVFGSGCYQVLLCIPSMSYGSYGCNQCYSTIVSHMNSSSAIEP